MLCHVGDAFLGRIHDNEALPWERLSITIAEADVDAAWVRDCAIDNKGNVDILIPSLYIMTYI